MCYNMKLYERVHENRPRSIMVMNEEQFGFMKGYSSTDAIVTLRQMQERYIEEQRTVCTFIWGKNIRQQARSQGVHRVHGNIPANLRRPKRLRFLDLVFSSPQGSAGSRQLRGKPHNLILEHLDSKYASFYWNKGVTLRFPKHLVTLLHALYIAQSACIRWNGRRSS